MIIPDTGGTLRRAVAPKANGRHVRAGGHRHRETPHTLPGIDHRNASLVIKAIAHATGHTHLKTDTE